jgi:hypothetical protein
MTAKAEMEFAVEVEILGRVRHKNLLSLPGFNSTPAATSVSSSTTTCQDTAASPTSIPIVYDPVEQVVLNSHSAQN